MRLVSYLRSQAAIGLVGLLLIFCCSGATCSRSFRSPFASVGPPAPEVLVPGAALDQVIAAVNQNASRIQSYQTNNASITVPGMTMLPQLRGNIAAERPDKLRLKASTAISGEEVDLGSNEDLFWFWVKRNEPPDLYFARHSQYVGSAAQQVMPIEPSWLLDALGFAQFDPNDFHEGPVPHGNGTLEIRSVIQTRIGTLTKSTVVDAQRAWVMAQHVYDAQGTLLASAIARSHQYYPTANVSLPQKVDISLPTAQLALSIDVGTVAINQGPLNPDLWQLPALAGYRQIDLGTAPPGAVSAMGAPGSNDINTLASPEIFGIGRPSEVVPSQYGITPTPANSALPTQATTGSTSPLLPYSQTQFVEPASTVVQPAAHSIQQQLPSGGIPLGLPY
ncbi:hypothetical protein [Bythopirellula goksoeyrii]|uniref:Uncharacterized protein n=1 Tax=Bythopirellula goksoeyrii TaxID=1400387 RepID=A0A5B9QBX5_9BACT|nr:hypothetical protein [Bythopirellula goksoeyrii]QEG35289.1 hypothetical protein Pr1d_25850 [Bythopirellula goksoeyrii]